MAGGVVYLLEYSIGAKKKAAVDVIRVFGCFIFAKC